jgi:energy-coupling factor transport system permease protein
LLPLLVSGLERALQLSEAMMARGFASDNPTIHQNSIRLTLLAGMALVPSGWLISLMEGLRNAGAALALSGLVLILLSLWLTGRRMPRSSYRKESWNLRSWAIILGSALTLAGLLFPFPHVSNNSLIYTPYPALNLPAFAPHIGVLLLGLLTPAWVSEAKRA